MSSGDLLQNVSEVISETWCNDCLLGSRVLSREPLGHGEQPRLEESQLSRELFVDWCGGLVVRGTLVCEYPSGKLLGLFWGSESKASDELESLEDNCGCMARSDRLVDSKSVVGLVGCMKTAGGVLTCNPP